jgi:hypothetical protein
MKTLEEINELAKLEFPITNDLLQVIYNGRVGYIKGYQKAQESLFTEEDMIKFAEYMANYHKCQEGWWHIYTPQTLENIKTTKELIEIWKSERNKNE